MRIAAIDVGTNSVHMIVCRIRPDLSFEVIDREKDMIENALRDAEGVIGGPRGAAAKLGIPRQTLESKIRKLGINRNLFKTS